ncbi:hypothetical protein [Phaeobacter sp. B1627]|uniref:hypothetical protein n=1 Tax=Phaeobacter sp. B1627 TaxID=2583809 RepID=UPI00111A34FF|nr:hypothetical protein [Phaeobacter sp. B1627]TNJ40735.1 hypothetical protein FGE21_16660 [Phaeobacter sp. B1627]
MKIDGRTIDLGADMLDKINLGRAMAIHKSQGAQLEKPGSCFAPGCDMHAGEDASLYRRNMRSNNAYCAL